MANLMLALRQIKARWLTWINLWKKNLKIVFADDLIVISDSPDGLQKELLYLLHPHSNNKWHFILSVAKKLVADQIIIFVE